LGEGGKDQRIPLGGGLIKWLCKRYIKSEENRPEGETTDEKSVLLSQLMEKNRETLRWGKGICSADSGEGELGKEKRGKAIGCGTSGSLSY